MKNISYNVVMIEDIIIDPSVSRDVFSKKALKKAATLIIEMGGAITPPVLREIGVDAYELVSGQFEYFAAVLASQIDESVETINAFVFDDENDRSAYEMQINTFRDTEVQLAKKQDNETDNKPEIKKAINQESKPENKPERYVVKGIKKLRLHKHYRSIVSKVSVFHYARDMSLKEIATLIANEFNIWRYKIGGEIRLLHSSTVKAIIRDSLQLNATA